jgi:hypothetical protein
MIERDQAQGLDEEWIRISEQNRPTDERGHKGDVDEVRVAPGHREPRLSRIDQAVQPPLHPTRITTSSCLLISKLGRSVQEVQLRR